jgi:aldehyde:ferredoxin oxidoreductase
MGMDRPLYGYMGKVLRVDLTAGSIHDEPLEPEMAEKYVGGTGFGVEYLYREVHPGAQLHHQYLPRTRKDERPVLPVPF